MFVECLNTLVGLSDRNCECTSQWFPNPNPNGDIPEVFGIPQYYVPQSQTDFAYYQQTYLSHTGNTIIWTQNNGLLPNDQSQIAVYQNGQRKLPAEYTIVYNTAPGQSQIIISTDSHFDGSNYQVVVASTPTIDFNTSDSGYYLTDSEYGMPLMDAIFANLNCDEANVWEALARAKTQAIRDFQGDLLQMLNATREQKIPGWKGLIGKTDGVFGGTSRRYTGIQLRPKLRSKDAYFIVTGLLLAIETPGSYTLEITSNDPEFVPITDTAVITTGQWTRHTFTTPIALPFYKINEESLRYTITLEANGSRFRFNKPYCCTKPMWAHYFDFGGFANDEIDNERNYCGTNFGGMAIEGYFDCKKLDWLCNLSELNGLDFKDLVARCIQLKGAIKLATNILESGRINYWTVLAPETLGARRAMLQDKYKEYMDWMVRNIPGNVSGCWGCNKHAPKMITISS